MASTDNPTQKIAILGAGIAGVTTAIGLRKLGYDVSVLYKKRAFISYEGFSEKTKDGLKMLGCSHAYARLQTRSSRNSNWANRSQHVNHEYVISRDELDEALLADAGAFGIRLIPCSVVGEVDFEKRPVVHYKSDTSLDHMEVDFVVDARGRFTPYKEAYRHGPKSFSILQELEVPTLDEHKTSIDSIRDGWVWQAFVGQNRAYLQFTCDEALANRIKSFEDLLTHLEDQDLDLWTLKTYRKKGKLLKRDAYSKIHHTIVNDKMILVGDSASSIDPLSGNGAFQAMSMSSIAPYVINTILNKKEYQGIAIEFYKKRVQFIFDKFAAVGREFYTMETRFHSPFWQARQEWPQLREKASDPVKIEQGAIVTESFIVPREVVITPENPLGVCFLGDIEIVDVVRFCLMHSAEESIGFINRYLKDLGERQKNHLLNWLYSQNILTGAIIR